VLSIRIVYTFLRKAITQAAMKIQKSAHCAQQVTCNLLLFAAALFISTCYHRTTRHSMRAHETTGYRVLVKTMVPEKVNAVCVVTKHSMRA